MWGMIRRFHRPSPKKEAWSPKRGSAPDPNVEVDPRFRKLKLRKRRARYRETHHVGLVIFAFFIVAIVVVIGAQQCAGLGLG